MDRAEYMNVEYKYIPQNIIEKYNLQAYVNQNLASAKLFRWLADQKLSIELFIVRFYTVQHTLGLWFHWICPIQLSFVVNYFFVKYTGQENATFLIDTLQKLNHQLTIIHTANQLCGVTLCWDYDVCRCYLLMPE